MRANGSGARCRLGMRCASVRFSGEVARRTCRGEPLGLAQLAVVERAALRAMAIVERQSSGRRFARSPCSSARCGANSRKTLRRVIEAYLRDFDRAAPGINEAAAHIRRALANSETGFGQWRVAQQEFRLFDPERGPPSIAARLLNDERPDDILVRCKLDDPFLSTGNYMMAVEDQVCAATPLVLRKQGEAGLQRVLEIIAPEGVLRFKSRTGETGRALLRPWLDGGRPPAPAIQDSGSAGIAELGR